MRKDIDLSFRPHPLTGDVMVVKEEKAIDQSLKNIVKTSFYERGFNVSFGTGVYSSLFENITDVTAKTLEKDITMAIKNFEPQADLKAVEVTEDGGNTLYIRIFYNFKNTRESRELSIDLLRVR